MARRVGPDETLPNLLGAVFEVTDRQWEAGTVEGDESLTPTGRESGYAEHAERARRLDVLQRAENEFDPIPFDAEAARIYGRVCAAVVSAGRKPRRRIADLMIAATAIAEGLPLFTTNPDDFRGLDELLTVVAVTAVRTAPDQGKVWSEAVAFGRRSRGGGYVGGHGRSPVPDE